jgi:hypothetical protein
MSRARDAVAALRALVKEANYPHGLGEHFGRFREGAMSFLVHGEGDSNPYTRTDCRRQYAEGFRWARREFARRVAPLLEAEE